MIVKAHPAHPGTSELVAGAIMAAVEKSGLPAGTFSLLHGVDAEVSIDLVTNPHIQAVAFTGSERAGRALFDAAAKRRQPIPVFSEMGSVNPMFLLKSSLERKGEATAKGVFQSVTLGAGQFCTCPGLIFAAGPEHFESFAQQVTKLFEAATDATMLNAAIAGAYANGFSTAASIGGVSKHQATAAHGQANGALGTPGLLITDASNWLARPELRREIFGPATILVRCESEASVLQCAEALDGSLTAAVHGSADELEDNADLVRVLARKAGRVIFNGYPTGVEVSHAMQHGGPYPATTDPRFTSVGTAAIYRFARPVCYQDFPSSFLPEELRDENPRQVWRLVNGARTKDPVNSAA